MNTIRIAAAVILNKQHDLLVVRKRGSSYYMLPGGKIENKETHSEALVREIKEELGFQLLENDFDYLGSHQTKAANEADSMVEGNIFLLKHRLAIDSIPHHAEIEEALWMRKNTWQSYKLAHLLHEFVIPKWLADMK